jgi:hypothetical protein
MSYAGLGSTPFYRGASFGGKRRRTTGLFGLLGLGAAAPTAPDMTFTLAETDPTVTANAAISAVIANPTAVQNRLPIPAVRTFQLAYGHGLAVDGIYGTNTRSALATVTGRTNLPLPPSPSAITSGTSYVSTPVPPALDPTLAPADSSPSAWLVPVAVVSSVVVVAGVVMMRRKKMASNRRRLLRNRRRRGAR